MQAEQVLRCNKSIQGEDLASLECIQSLSTPISAVCSKDVALLSLIHCLLLHHLCSRRLLVFRSALCLLNVSVVLLCFYDLAAGSVCFMLLCKGTEKSE